MDEEEKKKLWILSYMSTHTDESIDILAEKFVSSYTDEFHSDIDGWYPYGTPIVPEISMLLAKLYKENKVKRYKHYCRIWQDGYPRWFYIYFL